MNYASPLYLNNNNTTNGAAFNGTFDQSNPSNSFDPAALSLNNINPNNLDLGQYQNAQLQQQRFRDEQIRTQSQSPGLQQGSYHVSPVVPAKRGRPGEDNVGASPLPQQATSNTSRSQTPQQQYSAAYSSQQGNPSLQAPSNFQQPPNLHSQQPSPSPAMQNQQFRPQSVTQPPFPNQNFAQADGSMNNMSGSMNMPGMQPGQPFPGGVAGQGGMMGQYPGGQFQGQGPMMMNPQMQEIQRQQYQMRLHQQAQQQAAQQQALRGQQNAMNPNWNGRMNGQPNNRMVPPGAQNAMPKPPDTKIREFMINLQQMMQQHGQQLNPNPTVCGRPIQYFYLLQAVARFYSAKEEQKWPLVAQALGFPPSQLPQAPQEIKNIFDQNLLLYYNKFMQAQAQKRRMQQTQANQMMTGNRSSPNQTQNIGQPHQNEGPGSPQRQQSPATSNAQQPGVQSNNIAGDMNGANVQQRNLKNEHPNQTVRRTPSVGKVPQTSPRQVKQQTPVVDPPTNVDSSPQAKIPPAQPPQPDEKTLGPMYHPKVVTLTTYGGFDIGGPIGQAGAEISRLRAPDPVLDLCGPIDIHSLIMSLQSGFHSEIRYALDDIALISGHPIDLRQCEDLLEALIELAESSLEILTKNSDETSDVIHLDKYEILSKTCKTELKDIQDNPKFGNKDYESDCAVQRILTVTMIARNFSFIEGNPEFLSNSGIIAFISSAIRLIGTRKMLFLNARYTIEFMKDIVTLLSNISDSVELRSEEEALSLLHFLLAFGPDQTNSKVFGTVASFNFYEPKRHPYLPHSLDSFAKLLARDEPNRTFFKHIFTQEAYSTPPCSLLTRAFGLAISPIPERARLPSNGNLTPFTLEICRARLPFLSQGMLAADILSSLLPSTESNLAQTWLESGDSWAPSLLHLVLTLAEMDSHNQPPRHHTTHRVIEDKSPFIIVNTRALSTLNRLLERLDDSDKACVSGLYCTNETVLSTLMNQNLSHEVLRHLQTFFKVAK